MRICLLSSEHGPSEGIGISVTRLGRLLAREHEVTIVHPDAAAGTARELDEPSTLRHVFAERSRLPEIAFASEDHERSAAALLAVEEAYGSEPPDYLEVPDRRGVGLVPLQGRNGGHRSLRGTTVGTRLWGMAELIAVHDGNWPPPAQRMAYDLEREALRLADFVIWPGGDVLELYRRIVGERDFADAVRIPVPFEPGKPPAAPRRQPGGPLRILFAGRLARAKGVLDLVDACLCLEDPDWRLTLVGADSPTGGLRQSTRHVLETMAAGDERIEILDPMPHEELQLRFAAYDLLVVPSSFDVWPNVAMEAMRAGLPVLATPVGGLTEIVEDGVSGWLAEAAGRGPFEAALSRLQADRAELERVRASGQAHDRFLALGDEEAVLSAYRELLAERRRPAEARRRSGPPPLVTGVVPYFGESDLVGRAVRSLLDQSHPKMEVVVVDDGSFEAEDEVLLELASWERVRVLYEANRGDTAARNFGVANGDGAYFAFLDSDNHLEPDFVARALAMLEEDPELAYVTCWLRFFDDGDGSVEEMGTGGFAALGNAVRSDDAINSDGDAIAVIPREVFSRLGFRYEEQSSLLGDWEFYRRLRDSGRFGAVIPELLANYCVRETSLSRTYADLGHALAWDEALSRRRAARFRWEAER